MSDKINLKDPRAITGYQSLILVFLGGLCWVFIKVSDWFFDMTSIKKEDRSAILSFVFLIICCVVVYFRDYHTSS